VFRVPSFPSRKDFFSKTKETYTYTCVAGVSGRVTQDPIFTCRKNPNSDDGSHKKPNDIHKFTI
jgi:hypothetical protein